MRLTTVGNVSRVRSRNTGGVYWLPSTKKLSDWVEFCGRGTPGPPRPAHGYTADGGTLVRPSQTRVAEGRLDDSVESQVFKMSPPHVSADMWRRHMSADTCGRSSAGLCELCVFSPGTCFKASFHLLIFSSFCFRPASLTFRNVLQCHRQRAESR